MSGGSHDYICYQIENALSGEMKDAELNDLIDDIVKLAHDLEWADSCDISEEEYFETVRKFKQKWFEDDRSKRLEHIIDTKISNLRAELLTMIGCDTNESMEKK